MRRHDTDEETSRRCASQIERYWREQGWVVCAWAEKLPFKHEGFGRSHAVGSHWVVRSDLVNGHPVRKLES